MVQPNSLTDFVDSRCAAVATVGCRVGCAWWVGSACHSSCMCKLPQVGCNVAVTALVVWSGALSAVRCVAQLWPTTVSTAAAVCCRASTAGCLQCRLQQQPAWRHATVLGDAAGAKIAAVLLMGACVSLRQLSGGCIECMSLCATQCMHVGPLARGCTATFRLCIGAELQLEA